MAKHTQVYGKRGCLTIEPLKSRNQTDDVFNFDVSEIKPGQRTPEHKEKIIYQASKKDLPFLCGLFLGFLPAYRLNRSGKFLVFIRQKEKGGVYVKSVPNNGPIVSFPIDPYNCFVINDMLLHNLQESTMSCGGSLIDNIKGACGLYLVNAKKVYDENIF